jgi:hypothetical protein
MKVIYKISFPNGKIYVGSLLKKQAIRFLVETLL